MKTQQRTFGLSVLTPCLASKLMPAAQTQSRVIEVRQAMQKKQVDPTIAANIEVRHKQRAKRNGA